MEYNTILTAEATGEVTVKKSRFIAVIAPVETEAEATTFIKNKKKQYHDARHNCSCYIIGKGEIEKSSDDGEPSGTAGRPMLEVLNGAGLYNVVCVVTRYFGGVLLGTGGLVRAYQDAVKEALSSAALATTYTAQVINVTCDYNEWGKVESYLNRESYTIAHVDYTENVTSSVEVPVENAESVVATLTDITGGKATIEPGDIIEARQGTCRACVH